TTHTMRGALATATIAAINAASSAISSSPGSSQASREKRIPTAKQSAANIDGEAATENLRARCAPCADTAGMVAVAIRAHHHPARAVISAKVSRRSPDETSAETDRPCAWL